MICIILDKTRIFSYWTLMAGDSLQGHLSNNWSELRIGCSLEGKFPSIVSFLLASEETYCLIRSDTGKRCPIPEKIAIF